MLCRAQNTLSTILIHSFNCSSLEGRDPTKCYYRGKALNDGEKLGKNEIFGSECTFECNCRQGKFNCLNGECFANYGGPPRPECISSYRNGECCSEEVCGWDETLSRKPVFNISCFILQAKL